MLVSRPRAFKEVSSDPGRCRVVLDRGPSPSETSTVVVTTDPCSRPGFGRGSGLPRTLEEMSNTEN